MHHITDHFHKTPNQNGKFTKPYYSIRSVHADKVIDVAQDGPNVGTLILWQGYAGQNQSFKVVQENDYYVIICKKGTIDGQKQFCLSVSDETDNAKIGLALRTKPAANNQRFRIDSSAKHKKDYYIYTFCGKVLDVCQEKKDNGTRVIHYKQMQDNKKNQLWNFCNPKDITSSSSHND